MDLLLEPNFYNWLILAGIFFIIEVSSFTLLFLWLGISALVVAIINYFVPQMDFTWQVFIFAICSVLSVVIWQKVFKKFQARTGDNRMNRRADRYIGRTATLVEAIDNGRGKIQIEDSFWRVESAQDLAKGAKVRIIATEGVILQVEPA